MARLPGIRLFDHLGNEISPAPVASSQPPVVWREPPSSPPCPVLHVGDVAILSGAPGIGRRWLALELAGAAAVAESGPGQACGLTVRAGRSMVVDFGASPDWLIGWFDAMGLSEAAQRIGVWSDPAPIFNSYSAGPDGEWQPIFQKIREFQPSLVIINGLADAIAELSAWDGLTPWGVLNVMHGEARSGEFAILIVADDSKAARSPSTGHPGAAAVAGNRGWFDAAQTVLHMRGDGKRRTVECVKADFGSAGWRLDLVERSGTAGYVGFELVPEPGAGE